VLASGMVGIVATPDPIAGPAQMVLNIRHWDAELLISITTAC
jgi:hypothetical protein